MTDHTSQGKRSGEEVQEPCTSSSHPMILRIRGILIPLAVLLIGIIGFGYLEETAPRADKKIPVTSAAVVKTMEVEHSSHQVVVQAMGTIAPARQITLKSQVAGEIIRVSPEFVEGGYLEQGTEIAKVFDQDYRLVKAQQQSSVDTAAARLKLEMGQQDVARHEWELMGNMGDAGELDRELALRGPQLEEAQATLASASAQLQLASLDLERTTIRAPFNALIRTKSVDLGACVSSQEQIAELVGTDEYRVEATIPVDRLKWISIPRNTDEKGSEVRIVYGSGDAPGHERFGTVLKLLGDLEEQGRMARILISIKDPLNLENPGNEQPPLLIGEYVRVEIQGPVLEGVVRLPRSALRDNADVWIMKDDCTLQIREVDVVWRDADTVLVRDSLTDEEQVVVSDLAAPVQGMLLAIEASGGLDAGSVASKD